MNIYLQKVYTWICMLLPHVHGRACVLTIRALLGGLLEMRSVKGDINSVSVVNALVSAVV